MTLDFCSMVFGVLLKWKVLVKLLLVMTSPRPIFVIASDVCCYVMFVLRVDAVKWDDDGINKTMFIKNGCLNHHTTGNLDPFAVLHQHGDRLGQSSSSNRCRVARWGYHGDMRQFAFG